MSKTCSACRGKKIKCDGALPVCRACTKSRIPVECSYTAIAAPRVPKPDLLQKGAACYPCRQKKKKCDAKRPCSTCIAADKEADCQYKEDRRPYIKRMPATRIHAYKPALADPFEGSADSGEMLDMTYAAMDELDISGDFYHPPLMSPGTSSSSSSSSLTSYDFSTLRDFDSGMTDISSNPSQLASPSIGSSDTSSDKSFLSHDGTTSGVTVSNNIHDLSASNALSTFTSSRSTLLLFRTVFLAHRTQLGLCIPQPKLDALRSGEMNGHFVDPVLVHIAQLWGCFLCHFPGPDESVHLQTVLNIVSDEGAQMRNDPTTSIQALALLALYFLAKGDLYRGREYLLKATNVVMKYDLHIARPTMMAGSHSEYAGGLMLRAEIEALDEPLVSLCQLVYLDKTAELVLHLPTLFPIDMDQELQMLSNTNSVACSTSFLVQRTRSVCYLQQAKNISAQWDPNGSGDMSTSSWYSKYWELMRILYLHQADVRPAMLKASYSFDRELNVAFKLSHILTLTALAHMHDILASKHSESRRRCYDTLIELVYATDSMADEDYPLMDPVLFVCWTFAADVLNRERYSNDFTMPTETSIASMLNVLQRSAQKLKRVVPYVSDISIS